MPAEAKAADGVASAESDDRGPARSAAAAAVIAVGRPRIYRPRRATRTGTGVESPDQPATPPMHFELVDAVLERTPDSIRAIKQVTLGEEYLQDHFPGFPILPGVLMIETMAEAARLLIADRVPGTRIVLGGVRNVRYGAMVRPGERLEVEVTVADGPPDEAGRPTWTCTGRGVVRRPGDDAGRDGDTAVSGRFTMRPVR